jgi:hypothetical protein
MTDLKNGKEARRNNAFHSQRKPPILQSLSSNTVPTNANSHFPIKSPSACPQTALYLSLRNKRNILPLQQNPAQLPSLVLLRMYLHSIINHQIHKLVKALLTVSTRPQKQTGELTLIFPSMRQSICSYNQICTVTCCCKSLKIKLMGGTITFRDLEDDISAMYLAEGVENKIQRPLCGLSNPNLGSRLLQL